MALENHMCTVGIAGLVIIYFRAINNSVVYATEANETIAYNLLNVQYEDDS